MYSSDEYKQDKLFESFGRPKPNKQLRFFIGDVRDRSRLTMAMSGVNYVVHAAAMKQVPACEYNPLEAKKTNVDGAANVIEAAIETGVERVVALSTDKAVNPINLYGTTKLLAEKLFINANTLGKKVTKFSVVRYGNVLGSRGSVLNTFREQAETGVLLVTDKRMTRFWWTVEQAVDFVMLALRAMEGGEIFVPKLRSSTVKNVAIVVCEECRIRYTGIRPGEKLHEVLISSEEVCRTYEMSDMYIIVPDTSFFDFSSSDVKFMDKVPNDFKYSSLDVLIEDIVILKNLIGNIDGN